MVALGQDATHLQPQQGPVKIPHSLAPAMAAAQLLTTAWDLFLVHRHRETERSHTGILSAVCSYGNKRI